jgi:hypothetical protein
MKTNTVSTLDTLFAGSDSETLRQAICELVLRWQLGRYCAADDKVGRLTRLHQL